LKCNSVAQSSSEFKTHFSVSLIVVPLILTAKNVSRWRSQNNFPIFPFSSRLPFIPEVTACQLFPVSRLRHISNINSSNNETASTIIRRHTFRRRHTVKRRHFLLLHSQTDFKPKTHRDRRSTTKVRYLRFELRNVREELKSSKTILSVLRSAVQAVCPSYRGLFVRFK
jgi:hypothetical protein